MTIYYFQILLFTHSIITLKDASRLYSSRFSLDITSLLESCIITDEINEVLFSIPNDKVLGLDICTSLFFKRSWDIIGRDFITTARYFFDTNTLPRCVNVTRITLVPKIESLTTMNDFRPISCYNMMYKYIYKVIVSRLKGIFPDVIGPA